MSRLSPVVWSEGMHLAQHHFQAQSRYFEERTSFALSSLYFQPWGVAACELDAEALVNGTVVVRHARGVMPDGLPFLFPDEPPPEPLAIADLFSPTSTSQRVLLGIPAYQPNRANVANGERPPTDARFVTSHQEVSDDATGGDERPVEVGRKNFRLLLDGGEVDEDLVTLPLARVERDGSGRFIYAPEFVPPCLRIAASPRLISLLRGLVDTLDRKASTLRSGRESGPMADGGSDIVGFWLAHAVHSGLAPLRHHLQTASAHPEVLYRELARLGGALCTFAMDAHPRQLPDYDHSDLETTFSELDRHIRRHLDVVLPEGSVEVPLEAAEQFFYRADLRDPRCLQPSARWFLGIRSGLARSKVLQDVPRLVKVCSDDGIKKLVQRAYDGLPVQHVPSPPAALSPRIGTEYFLLRGSGPCWKAIQMSEGVGVYMPGSLADADVELRVVLEE